MDLGDKLGDFERGSCARCVSVSGPKDQRMVKNATVVSAVAVLGVFRSQVRKIQRTVKNVTVVSAVAAVGVFR